MFASLRVAVASGVAPIPTAAARREANFVCEHQQHLVRIGVIYADAILATLLAIARALLRT